MTTAPLPAWLGDYIGLPFKPFGRDRGGVDCWGLVRLVLAERFGVDVPSYVGRYPSTVDHEALGRLIRGEMEPWLPVVERDAKGAIAFGAERAGDVVLLRLYGQPMHVGIVIAPRWMLHVQQGIDTARERYDGLMWEKRVVGIYRWSGGC